VKLWLNGSFYRKVYEIQKCLLEFILPFRSIQDYQTQEKIAPDCQAGVKIYNFSGSGLPQIITRFYRKQTDTQHCGYLFLPVRLLVWADTRGYLFLPVRLLVWADGRGTVAQADSAASAELQEAPKQKLLQLTNIQKYHWVKHREMLICCLGVSPDM
jgi:hypothetical protein